MKNSMNLFPSLSGGCEAGGVDAVNYEFLIMNYKKIPLTPLLRGKKSIQGDIKEDYKIKKGSLRALRSLYNVKFIYPGVLCMHQHPSNCSIRQDC